MNVKGKPKKKLWLRVIFVVLFLILGFMGLVVYRILTYARPGAKVRTACIQIKNLETALSLYYLDNGFHPTTEQGLQALVKKPRMAPIPNNYNPNAYIDGLPLDPWQGEYQYRLTGEKKNPFVITCYGRDGKPGGKGVDADITNLDLNK